ncbi:MAG: M20 family metallo-hydrolase [Bacteroidaceae bacterium]|nr:M20 family metallo-hydrolase [Bacteroidaceae bacterium]
MTDDERTTEALQLLETLIAIPSHSREEANAANALQQWMEERGLQPTREVNNLWCVAPHYQGELPTLLLCAHIDTVRPATGWTREPYHPTWEGDVLYGLGSNDDGASLVSLLQAFRVMCTKERSYNLVFLASAEEEVGGKTGAELALTKLPHIDVGLVGEPTGMQPAIAEKGLMVLDVIAHGRAGHAARNEGDNAIYHALDDMQWFRTYQFPEVSELLGPVKMTVTVVNAGTQHNVVPAECKFLVDVRSNELYSNEEIFTTIREHVKSDVEAHSFRLNSSRIAIEHPLVQRAIALGRQPFGSPTLSDQALMRFPTLKMGPGDSRRSHTADEFIRRQEIEEAIDLYVRLLSDLSIAQG